MRVQALLLAVLVLITILPAPLLANDPTVLARVLKADRDFKSYSPLKEASVTILADGDRFAVMTLAANSDGLISFEVHLNTPFSLVFQGGGDRVPQMTSLAGERNSSNLINVCLLTINEYMERYGDLAYEKAKSDIESMLLEIKRVRNATDGTSPELDELEDFVKSFRSSLG